MASIDRLAAIFIVTPVINNKRTCYVDEKTLTIYLFNNSEKLVQIILEFSQQIVEGYEFVLAQFHWKRPFQSTKICGLNQNLGWTFWPYFTFVYKMR